MPRFYGQVTGWQLRCRSVSPFIVGRRLVVESRVPPVRVVPPLDEVEDRQSCFGSRLEASTVRQLALEGREEILAHRIVEAIGDRSHRRPDSRLPAPPPERDGGILAALIGMVDPVARDR